MIALHRLRAFLHRNFGFAALWMRIQLRDLENSRQYVSGRLLDVGCGSKPYQNLLSGRYTEYVGIDYPKTASGIPTADAFASVRVLPFADQSFDTVLCTQVLEHVPEPWAALGEMRRVLKPYGYLVLSVPMMSPLHEEPHDYFRFTNHGLDYWLRATDFNPILIKPQGGFWLMMGQLLGFYVGSRLDLSHRLRANLVIHLAGILLSVFCLLDRVDFAPGYTMNWFILARRVPVGLQAPSAPLS